MSTTTLLLLPPATSRQGGSDCSTIPIRCNPGTRLPLSSSQLALLAGSAAEARYAVLRSFGEGSEGREYYGEYYDVLLVGELRQPQTLLAYETSGAPCRSSTGAPLRLHIETRFGFMMVKWIKSIELTKSYDDLGEDQCGYQEDQFYFGARAEI